jgi:hypothetical protein
VEGRDDQNRKGAETSAVEFQDPVKAECRLVLASRDARLKRKPTADPDAGLVELCCRRHCLGMCGHISTMRPQSRSQDALRGGKSGSPGGR